MGPTRPTSYRTSRSCHLAKSKPFMSTLALPLLFLGISYIFSGFSTPSAVTTSAHCRRVSSHPLTTKPVRSWPLIDWLSIETLRQLQRYGDDTFLVWLHHSPPLFLRWWSFPGEVSHPDRFLSSRSSIWKHHLPPSWPRSPPVTRTFLIVFLSLLSLFAASC